MLLSGRPDRLDGRPCIPPEYHPATETVTRVVPKSKSQIDSFSATIGGKKRKLTLE